MINGFRITILVLVLLNSSILYPQATTECGETQGLIDPVLINGRIYTYFLPQGVGGNQFLEGPGFVKGSVTIRDKSYKDRLLNYDVYNQQLLYKYTSPAGAPEIIEISRAWLKGFTLGNKTFIYHPVSPADPGFYQVIGEGPLKIYVQWHKQLELNNVTTNAHYVFSGAVRQMFLVSDDQMKVFRNRRTFLKRIDPAMVIRVRKYLRSNHIRVNKASDKQMTGLINYCNSLLP